MSLLLLQPAEPLVSPGPVPSFGSELERKDNINAEGHHDVGRRQVSPDKELPAAIVARELRLQPFKGVGHGTGEVLRQLGFVLGCCLWHLCTRVQNLLDKNVFELHSVSLDFIWDCRKVEV